ncbi:unnamed protein product [Caenorhabditis auriculariae]|uniref:Uncharacterized protein n=1 Tax=Caenorhabditis auriculariae TaxID=2777116 RepID=A0A8S1H8I9_9PELO|nr:unnamed protein product [Caenorhabditis auriculariae]
MVGDALSPKSSSDNEDISTTIWIQMPFVKWAERFEGKKKLDYDTEITSSESIAKTFIALERILDDVSTDFGGRVFADFSSSCVNQLHDLHEEKAKQGLNDGEYFPHGCPIFRRQGSSYFFHPRNSFALPIEDNNNNSQSPKVDFPRSPPRQSNEDDYDGCSEGFSTENESSDIEIVPVEKEVSTQRSERKRRQNSVYTKVLEDDYFKRTSSSRSDRKQENVQMKESQNYIPASDDRLALARYPLREVVERSRDIFSDESDDDVDDNFSLIDFLSPQKQQESPKLSRCLLSGKPETRRPRRMRPALLYHYFAVESARLMLIINTKNSRLKRENPKLKFL